MAPRRALPELSIVQSEQESSITSYEDICGYQENADGGEG
jgi:hypothetical protein